MRHKIIYAGACLLAFLAPWLSATPKAPGGGRAGAVFPGWPKSFEGRELTQLPLSEREERFGGDFPGRIARFTDGRREVIVRFVTDATRKLHPASDCFVGLGYRVRPLPLRVDDAGARWGSFTAERGGEKFRVYERIYADAGGSWEDVSAWYWAAAGGGNSPGPWWAVTVAEREGDQCMDRPLEQHTCHIRPTLRRPLKVVSSGQPPPACPPSPLAPFDTRLDRASFIPPPEGVVGVAAAGLRRVAREVVT